MLPRKEPPEASPKLGRRVNVKLGLNSSSKRLSLIAWSAAALGAADSVQTPHSCAHKNLSSLCYECRLTEGFYSKGL